LVATCESVGATRASACLAMDWYGRSVGRKNAGGGGTGFFAYGLLGSRVDMLQDLMLAAVNDALARSQEMVSSEMGKLTGGLKLPGLM